MERCLASRHADLKRHVYFSLLHADPAKACHLIVSISDAVADNSISKIWGHMTFLLHCSCPCCCSCLPCKDIYRSTEASLAILPLFAFHHVCRSEASLVIQKHHCFDTKPGFILHTSEHTSKTTIRFIFFRVIVPLEGFKIRNAAGEW